MSVEMARSWLARANTAGSISVSRLSHAPPRSGGGVADQRQGR